VKELLEGKFEFEPVGRLEIKNVGPMETFFLGKRKTATAAPVRPSPRST
jgi:hypothetical protein